MSSSSSPDNNTVYEKDEEDWSDINLVWTEVLISHTRLFTHTQQYLTMQQGLAVHEQKLYLDRITESLPFIPKTQPQLLEDALRILNTVYAFANTRPSSQQEGEDEDGGFVHNIDDIDTYRSHCADLNTAYSGISVMIARSLVRQDVLGLIIVRRMLTVYTDDWQEAMDDMREPSAVFLLEWKTQWENDRCSDIIDMYRANAFDVDYDNDSSQFLERLRGEHETRLMRYEQLSARPITPTPIAVRVQSRTAT